MYSGKVLAQHVKGPKFNLWYCVLKNMKLIPFYIYIYQSLYILTNTDLNRYIFTGEIHADIVIHKQNG